MQWEGEEPAGGKKVPGKYRKPEEPDARSSSPELQTVELGDAETTIGKGGGDVVDKDRRKGVCDKEGKGDISD